MCMRKLILSAGAAVAAVFAAQAGEVEITVASGEKTLVQARADEAKTLGLTDDLVKLGAGKLNIGALPEYAGNIHIKEGVVYATATNAFGLATGYTKVYNGAQVQTFTNAVQTLNFCDEQFIIEGTGTDGKGAIRCLATVNQNSIVNPFGKKLTLAGDALITDSVRHDLFGTTDLGGHTLTLKGGSFSFEGSVTTNGNVIASGGTAVFPTQCSFPGDASNVFTLTNNAGFNFCWSVLSKAFWTLDVRGGTVRFVFGCTGYSGLNGGTNSYGIGEANKPLVCAAYTNTPYLMLTNAVTKNMPRMETSIWNNNELVTYAGYLWNTNVTDITWTWHVCIDDACDVFLDGKRVISQTGWMTMITTNITLTPGPHAFAVRAYNGTGGSGASNANGMFKDSSGINCNTKGLAVDIQARGMVTNSDYYAALKDPGDGTLFTTSLQLAKFATMKFATGTGIDFDDMTYTLEHLIGLPSVTNGDLTVTGDWTVDGADLVAGRTAASSGKIVFADGVTLEIDDTRWGGKGNSGMTVLTAEGGIEGDARSRRRCVALPPPPRQIGGRQVPDVLRHVRLCDFRQVTYRYEAFHLPPASVFAPQLKTATPCDGRSLSSSQRRFSTRWTTWQPAGRTFAEKPTANKKIAPIMKKITAANDPRNGMAVKLFLLKPVYRVVVCILLAIRAQGCFAGSDTPMIARSGTALAQIVVPVSATPVELSAAHELQEHLEKVTGASFTITPETARKSGPRLLVGNTAAAHALMPGFDPAALADDGIVLKTVGDDLVLAGHPKRGTLYAVYTFLEDAVGVRWWTSEETFIPRKPNLPLPVLDVCYAPKLRFRESYYLDSFNALFKTRLKGNYSSRTRYMLAPMEMIPETYGGNHRLIYFKGRNSAYHSFYELLPPEKYFKDHPEWYSEINGQRTCQKSQLCLTNEEMRKELTKNALALLRDDPGADMIQISQNDGMGRCECEACLAVEKEEGGLGTASGPLLRFVNKVATDIEKEFPNVFIDTFAYQYTRHAPAQVRPRHNVLIRLCDIECSFLQPLEGSKENEAFCRDLADWSCVAGGNLFGWDYVTSFESYMLPHPNLRVLAPNIRTFVKYGATGLFEQGDALCSAGDFVRLRHWVISHLLWNPDLDENQLIDTFLTGYYGEKTGAALKSYLTFIHDRAEKANIFLGCYQNNVTSWLDADGILEATRLMETALTTAQAEEAADPVGKKGLGDKVLREKLSIDHVWLINAPMLRRHTKADETGSSKSADPLAACQIWIAACTQFQVKAYCETTSKAMFSRYKKTLLTSFMNAAKPAEVPDICKGVPPNLWMDWQEFEFNRRPAEQVSLVKDAAASNKYAARMPGNHKIWAVQFPLMRFFVPNASGGVTNSPQACRIVAYVRAEASVQTGSGVTLGVYDFAEKKMVVSRTIPVREIVGPVYRAIDLGQVEIKQGRSFWAAPPERPGEVKAVFVDRVVVINVLGW